jgi:hypothetical protein
MWHIGRQRSCDSSATGPFEMVLCLISHLRDSMMMEHVLVVLAST